MKYWTESKTMRFNVAMLLMSATDAFIQYAYAIEGVIDPALYPWLFFGAGVVNVLLRKLTNTGIR